MSAWGMTVRGLSKFDKAAETYESATPVQRQTAEALAQRIAAAGLPGSARVAEFGCGTGYLAEAAWEAVEPALWVATDLSPAMAAIAAVSLSDEAVVAVMDAGRPALAAGFDMVCSSLTLQWVADPKAAISSWRTLVRPGGVLAVATLVEGSFAQWRAALAEAGVTAAGPAFPDLDELKTWFAPEAAVEVLTLTDRHDSALEFARAAQAAGIDASDRRALTAGVMRQALKAFERDGSAVTYQVALIIEMT